MLFVAHQLENASVRPAEMCGTCPLRGQPGQLSCRRGNGQKSPASNPVRQQASVLVCERTHRSETNTIGKGSPTLRGTQANQNWKPGARDSISSGETRVTGRSPSPG